ncbi:MAG: hypothetical protein ACR5KV_00300 [Wolbachia sp.]
MGGLKLIEPINIDQLEPLPTLYSDFKLCELYKYKQNPLWRKESCFPIDFRRFSGRHFYILENMIEIALFINNKIKKSLL